MSRPRRPLSFARRSLRRRRVIDASRSLPIMGAFLFLLPVLWSLPGAERDAAPGLAEQGLYIFVIWGLLIAAAGLIGFGLSRDMHDDISGRDHQGGDLP